MDFTEPVLSKLSPLECGALLDGKYEILKLLGSGGFGSVYQAHHVGTDKMVAVKVLHPSLAIDADALNRFQREARIISSLRHDNILNVYAFGTTSDGFVYMSTEFVDGRSLAEYIAERGALGVQEAMPIVEQICKGMQYAHENNVLHRDLKPANVIIVTDKITGAPTAKIVDFGLARLIGDRSSGQVLTQTGEVVGDPNYMSPEQCQGRPLDVRSDIYSFGCLLYAVFTGSPPFFSETPVASLFKQISEPPKPFAAEKGLPKAVEAITLTALSKDPQKRYASFQLLHETLQDFVTNPGLSISAPQALPQAVARLGQSKKGIALIAIALLVGALILLAGGVLLNRQAVPKQTAAAEADAQTIAERLRDLDVQWHKRRQLPPLSDVRNLVAAAERSGDRVSVARAKVMLVWVLAMNSQHEDSLRVTKEVLAMPEFPESDRDMVMEQAARSAYSLGNFSESEKISQALVNSMRTRKNPNKGLRVDQIMQLIDIELRLNKRDEAEKLCREVCSEYPAHPDGTRNFEVFARSSLGKQVARYKLNAGRYKEADEIIAAMDQTQLTEDGRPTPAYDLGLTSACSQKLLGRIDSLVDRAMSAASNPYEKVVYLESVVKGLVANGTLPKAESYLGKMKKLAGTAGSGNANQITGGTASAEDWVAVAQMYVDRGLNKPQSVIKAGEPLLLRITSKPGNNRIVEECNWVMADAFNALQQPRGAAAVSDKAENYFSSERACGRY